MESGLPRFRPGFTCPAILRCQLEFPAPSSTGLSPCLTQLSRSVRLRQSIHIADPTTPEPMTRVWALPISLAATQGISFDFFSSAYLDVSVRQVSPLYPMDSDRDDGILLPPGCPIRRPPDPCFLPAPRRLSQVNASFFARRCQGIHQQLLIA